MPVARRRAALDTFMGASANMAAASLQAILLTPLALHRVGPSLYGAWLASGEMLVWMLAFDFGIPNLLIQRIGAAFARGDYEACGRDFAAGMLALGGMAALLAAALCALSPFVPLWLHLSGGEASTLSTCFVIASLATCTMLLDYGIHGLARGLQNTRSIYRFALAGTLLGFVLTASMLAAGYGLIAIALGLVVRVGVAFLGSVVFFFRVDPRIRRACKLQAAAARELLTESPPMFLSGLAVAVMNNSGITFAAALLGPATAASYGITKRAVDLARSLSDMIGFASYGGFSHLYASGAPDKTRAVYAEIHAIYAAVAVALTASVIAVNPSLVATWVGPGSYAGLSVSVLIALGSLASGWSYLAVSLLRSMGETRRGSWAVVLDCAIRLPLMAVLARALGLVGLPLAGLLTATVAGVWAHRRCVAILGPIGGRSPWMWPVRTAVLILAVAIAFEVRAIGWGRCLPLGAASLAVGALALVGSDPGLRSRVPRLGRGVAPAA